MLSIITPVLNGKVYIEENIKAISRLSVPFEHIIVDGGSTDGTIEKISLYPHVKLIMQNDRGGMYSAINSGIKEASGEYVAYVNCDDIIDPDKFSLMYNSINDSEYDLIYSDSFLKYSETKRSEYFKSAEYLFSYFIKNGIMPFNQPGSIYTKKVFNTVGGFDSQNFKFCGDLHFFRKVIALEGIKIKYLNIPTVTFLVHPDSLTSLNSGTFYEEYKRGLIPMPTFFTRAIYFISRLLRL